MLGIVLDRRRPSWATGGLLAAAALCVALVRLPEPPPPPVVEDAEVPDVALEIVTRDLMLMDLLRQQFIADMLMTRKDNDEVPAKVVVGGKRMKSRVRLKGDHVDHLYGDKWSWRVTMKGDAHFKGMRRFNLQAPLTRKWHLQPTQLDHFREEGILVPRYSFARLKVNTDDVGLMAVEEHISTEMLESQGRKDAVMVGFDETDFFAQTDREAELGIGGVMMGWRAARVRVFGEGRVKKDAARSKQADLAASLLRGMQNGTLAPSEVFDVELFGRWLAVSDLWYAWHGVRWHNQRYYYNPQTVRLEPIAFDTANFRKEETRLFGDVNMYAKDLLMDPVILESYQRHLDRMLDPSTFPALAERRQASSSKLVDLLKTETPELKADLGAWLTTRAEWLRSFPPVKDEELAKFRIQYAKDVDFDRPVDIPYGVAVHAQTYATPKGTMLELRTPLREDVVLTELTASGTFGRVSIAEDVGLELPLTIQAGYRHEVTPTVRVWLPAGTTGVQGVAHLPVNPEQPYSFSTTRTVAPLTQPLREQRLPVDDVLSGLSWLSFDGRDFQIEPGSWTVEQPLVIPEVVLFEGRTIENPGLGIAAGTELAFAPHALLQLSGPLLVRGTEEAPVLFRPVQDSWRGVAVLGSPRPSRVMHARFEKTEEHQHGALHITGAVTFYRNSVTLDHVEFAGTNAEDALNLVHSPFILREVTVQDVRSDAIDIDFSKGDLQDVLLERVLGDGLDLGSADIRVQGLTVVEVRDKAVSVGESSTLTGSGLRIQDVGAGVVSKEGSSVEVTNVTLSEVHGVAFMSYLKKPEYGPSSLKADRITGERTTLVQHGNSVVLDGVAQPTRRVDVEALYASGRMKDL